MKRPSWNQYWMDVTRLASSRATCLRAQVGCAIVKDNQLLAIGYNGSLPGLEHCSTVGCDIVDNHCVRTSHAECNAIASAARRGVAVEGATIYTNFRPCWTCFKLIISSGITEIVYKEEYGIETRIEEALKLLKDVHMRKWEEK